MKGRNHSQYRRREYPKPTMHNLFLFVAFLISSLRTNAFSLQMPSNAKLQAKSVSTSSPTKLPFLVQQLGKDSQASKSDAEEISEIVISVFFEEEAEKSEEKRSKGSITKPLILAYLKNLQYGTFPFVFFSFYIKT